METGNRRREKGRNIKSLNSSRLRPPVSILLFFIVIQLSAFDSNRPVCGLSSGVLIDVAPFGIEQTYFMVQGTYTLPGALAFSLRPSFSLNNSSKMLRLPLVLNLSNYIDKNEFALLSCYLGGGLELYRSTDHNVESLLLTGGITMAVGNFYMDIPVVSAYRSYNTDSDIGITVGLYFQR